MCAVWIIWFRTRVKSYKQTHTRTNFCTIQTAWSHTRGRKTAITSPDCKNNAIDTLGKPVVGYCDTTNIIRIIRIHDGFEMVPSKTWTRCVTFSSQLQSSKRLSCVRMSTKQSQPAVSLQMNGVKVAMFVIIHRLTVKSVKNHKSVAMYIYRNSP